MPVKITNRVAFNLRYNIPQFISMNEPQAVGAVLYTKLKKNHEAIQGSLKFVGEKIDELKSEEYKNYEAAVQGIQADKDLDENAKREAILKLNEDSKAEIDSFSKAIEPIMNETCVVKLWALEASDIERVKTETVDLIYDLIELK